MVAKLAGTSLDRAKETCLRDLEGKLFERLVVKTNSDWVLPLGVYHRKRRRPAMQFCPLCLAQDEFPYYRRSWRLALSTFCTVHDTMLHECCPKCQAPVMFHRQELGDRWTSKIASFTLCTSCGYDLVLAPLSPAPILEYGAWTALKRQRMALNTGWFAEDAVTFQYSHLYFIVLRNLMQKMRGRWSTSRLLAFIAEMFGAALPTSRRFNEPFEFFGVYERDLFLQAATWYMQDWPDRFINVCRDLKVRYSEVMREFSPVPYWFLKEASHLEFKPLGPSTGELAAMRQLLEQSRAPRETKVLRKAIKQRLANGSMRILDNAVVDRHCVSGH